MATTSEQIDQRLIDASPDLLEACRAALTVILTSLDYQKHPGTIGKLILAIASATGMTREEIIEPILNKIIDDLLKP